MSKDKQNSGSKNTAKPRVSEPGWFALRQSISPLKSLFFACGSVAVVFGLWWFATYNETPEFRRVGPNVLPSVPETFGKLKALFQAGLTWSILATLRRVAMGFGLACMVGVPLGILAGCFASFRSFMAPLIVFGRNIPIAALIPLTILAFGIDEPQKVGFIFIASVAFVIADSTQAIMDVEQRFVDTARTLGASTWQIMIKVLVPLAMPNIFNSLRILFGLAFGYIMLAEVIGSEGGLGFMISTYQKKSAMKFIYLILLIIPMLAFAIDRFLYWVQVQLFPHRYGGPGFLRTAMREVGGLWDDVKCAIVARWRSAGNKTDWQA